MTSLSPVQSRDQISWLVLPRLKSNKHSPAQAPIVLRGYRCTASVLCSSKSFGASRANAWAAKAVVDKDPVCPQIGAEVLDSLPPILGLSPPRRPTPGPHFPALRRLRVSWREKARGTSNRHHSNIGASDGGWVAEGGLWTRMRAGAFPALESLHLVRGSWGEGKAVGRG
jgi:hypothetical protein